MIGRLQCFSSRNINITDCDRRIDGVHIFLSKHIAGKHDRSPVISHSISGARSVIGPNIAFEACTQIYITENDIVGVRCILQILIFLVMEVVCY